MDSTKNNIEEQRILSLCTGMRGIERGIEYAGTPIRTVANVEIEAFSIENLVAAMEAGLVDSAPIWTDIKTFDAKPFYNRVHGITGGYPCQPFSIAGQRKGTDDPRHLWPYIREIVQTIRPVWCFFENVPGHLKMGYDEVYRSLRDMGYRVEPGIFSASEVGATHRRQRLFILAMDNTISRRYKPFHEIQTRRFCPELSSENLVDTSNKRLSIPRQKHKRELQEENQERMDDRFEQPSVHSMANTECPGFQEWEKQSAWEKCSTTKRRNFNKWPALQGQQQHQWEEPRTIKPGLGCTIDGYNFRTDLLRAYGNAVVYQTAAKAWIELNKKIK